MVSNQDSSPLKYVDLDRSIPKTKTTGGTIEVSKVKLSQSHV